MSLLDKLNSLNNSEKEEKLWCPYYKPCGMIGSISCKYTDMYDCSYEGDLNKCNMKSYIISKLKTEENLLGDL